MEYKKKLIEVSIPLKKIKNLAERTMIERYCKEYHHGRFGIYQGNETQGTVKKLF